MTYSDLKLFFQVALPHVFPCDDLPPDENPLSHLARAEEVSEKRAMQSLRLGIAELLSFLRDASPETLRDVARELSDARAPSIAMVRGWFSKKTGAILSRGKIATEDEFHLIGSMLEDPELSDDERAALQSLLDRFEFGG